MNPNPYSQSFPVEVEAFEDRLNSLKMSLDREEARQESSYYDGPRTRSGNNKQHEAKHRMKKKKAMAAQSRKRNRR